MYLDLQGLVFENARPILIEVFEGDRNNPRHSFEKQSIDSFEIKGTVLPFTWDDIRKNEAGQWTQKDRKFFTSAEDSILITLDDNNRDYVFQDKGTYYRIKSNRNLAEHSNVECFLCKRVVDDGNYKPDSRPTPEPTERVYWD